MVTYRKNNYVGNEHQQLCVSQIGELSRLQVVRPKVEKGAATIVIDAPRLKTGGRK